MLTPVKSGDREDKQMTDATAHEIVVALNSINLHLFGIALTLMAIALNELFFK